MPRRLIEPAEPITITLDGEAVVASRGEPLACALVAAGHLALARSPKFHRPRGPSCFRAACDGCLARVDGVPNVMTCMVPARDGAEVVAQNTLGSRDLDLLRMTDWFFPDGMNHHELFAGVPGVQQVMQAFARRVAGLGKLPSAQVAPRKAARRAVDAVVVGSGPFGMAAATHLASRGIAVEVIDDAPVYGGSLRALPGASRAPWRAIDEAFARAAQGGAVRVRTATTAAGLYGDDVLVVGPEGAEVLEARVLVLAPGAHDGVLAFEGNDLPGVLSARAAGVLLGYGVCVGERVVVAVAEGGGPFGEAFVDELRTRDPKAHATIVHAAPSVASGTSRVKRVVFAETERRAGEKVDADALLVDAPRAPAYELCEQAGARLVHRPSGYAVDAPHGKIRDGVWAVGEVCGARLAPDAALEAAAAITL